jgi:hypothetical protein
MCAVATFPTTNPTWTELGTISDLRAEKPVTDRLSYGKAYWPTC